MVPRDSPGDAGQRGYQACKVEGPGAAVTADELATITAHGTLVLVLLPQGSRQGVSATATNTLGGTSGQPASVAVAGHVLARDIITHHPFALHPHITHLTPNLSRAGIACSWGVVAP